VLIFLIVCYYILIVFYIFRKIIEKFESISNKLSTRYDFLPESEIEFHNESICIILKNIN